MRVLTWSLGHGRADPAGVEDVPEATGCDLAVLTEYRAAPGAGDLAVRCRCLRVAGSDPAAGSNGLLVVARRDIEVCSPSAGRWASRSVSVILGHGIRVHAVLAPTARRGLANTRDFWRSCLPRLRADEGRTTLLVGDLKAFGAGLSAAALAHRTGWTAGRRGAGRMPVTRRPRRCSGWGPSSPRWRSVPDHVLLAPGLSRRLRSARVVHELGATVLARPRGSAGRVVTGAVPLSDRPALVVDVNLAAGGDDSD